MSRYQNRLEIEAHKIWKEEPIYVPYSGNLRMDTAGFLIGDNDSTVAENMLFQDGKVTNRPGLRLLGSNLPLLGSIKVLKEFEKFNGTRFLMAITTKHIYKKGEATTTWDVISAIYNTGRPLVTNGSPTVDGSAYQDAIVFTGTGLNDMTRQGTFTGLVNRQFRVEIDTAAVPDKFKWSKDGGATWDATLVVITGGWQTLTEGVQVKFNATTGHTLGDRWDWNSYPATLWTTNGVLVDSYFQIVGDATLYKVLTVGGETSITLTTNYAGTTGNKEYRIHKCLSGTDDDAVSADQMNDLFIWTNGVDPIYSWNGSDLGQTVVNTGVLCKALAAFEDHMHLFATKEGGVWYYQRHRWSDIGDPTGWAGATSGFNDMVSSADAIVGVRKIEEYLLVYRKRSIWSIRWLGSTTPWAWVPEIEEFGTVFGMTIPGRDPQHFIVDNEMNQVYEINKASPPKPISIPVEPVIQQGEREKPNRWWGYLHPTTTLVYIGVIPAGGNYVNKVLVYNYTLDKWTVWTVANWTAMGTAHIQEGVTWDDIHTPWDEYHIAWDDPSLASKFPGVVVGDKDGYVYILSWQVIQDNGVDIRWILSTRDYAYPGRRVRIKGYYLLVSGSGNCLVGFSTAQSLVNQVSRNIVLNSQDNVIKLSVLPASKQFYRINFTGTGTCQFSWGKLIWRPRGIL